MKLKCVRRRRHGVVYVCVVCVCGGPVLSPSPPSSAVAAFLPPSSFSPLHCHGKALASPSSCCVYVYVCVHQGAKPKDVAYTYYTWKQYDTLARTFARALVAINFKPHDAINILGFNSVRTPLDNMSEGKGHVEGQGRAYRGGLCQSQSLGLSPVS